MSTDNCPTPRSTYLLDVLTILLAPIFLEATGNDLDLDLAKAAAVETIEEYRARTGADLILVAQIIAFGLASIAAIMQAAQPDTPPDTTLKLYGKANSLGRSGDQCRKALSKSLQATPDAAAAAILATTAPPARASADTAPETRTAAAPGARAPAPAIEPVPDDSLITSAINAVVKPATIAAGSNPDRDHAIWADGFAEIAREIAAKLPSLPTDQRRTANLQIGALNRVATSFRTEVPAKRPA